MNEPRNISPWQRKLPFKQSLLIILLSICFVSGTSFGGLIYYQHLRDKQRQDDAYRIVAVLQTSPEREGLKTGYLTELLELSVDRPRNLYDFNTGEAAQKLLQSPVIKEVVVKKIRPGTIHVDYVLRKPIAYIGDYTNTAVDAEGIIFPFKPFYTPKKLPEMYFGSALETYDLSWGTALNGATKELAFEILELAPQYCDEFTSLRSIDVSNAFAASDGQTQIVIILEDRLLRVENGQTVLSIHPRILRLRQDNFKQQLGNYIALRTYLREHDRLMPLSGTGTVQHSKSIIIDLRLSELAFFVSES